LSVFSSRALGVSLDYGLYQVLSGDLFRMDQEGYLYFVGRKDDIIKTRGEKVRPREVEEVLYGIEGVAEADVVGTPDAFLGDAIKAVICLRPDTA
jgi:long-chain acyl-CoA synthetase